MYLEGLFEVQLTGAFFGAAFFGAAFFVAAFLVTGAGGAVGAGVTLFECASRGCLGALGGGIGLGVRVFFATAVCEAAFFPVADVAFFGGILTRLRKSDLMGNLVCGRLLEE
jgi:hypothetical protein